MLVLLDSRLSAFEKNPLFPDFGGGGGEGSACSLEVVFVKGALTGAAGLPLAARVGVPLTCVLWPFPAPGDCDDCDDCESLFPIDDIHDARLPGEEPFAVSVETWDVALSPLARLISDGLFGGVGCIFATDGEGDVDDAIAEESAAENVGISRGEEEEWSVRTSRCV